MLDAGGDRKLVTASAHSGRLRFDALEMLRFFLVLGMKTKVFWHVEDVLSP